MRRGYIEARMKLPAGAGIWCALWGQNLAYFKGDKTKGHVEIDGFEHYGALPHKISTTVHDWSDPAFPGRKPGKSLAENNSLPDLSEDFHVYGVLVGKDTVVTYIDGVRANVAAIAQEGIDKFAWTIDLAIGGGWPVAASPTHNYELDISSVKIWSADSD